MTVIYFLYLFAFMEMLPPRDLGSVVLKSHETEPTGPHHPPPTTLTSLHPSLMGLGVCNAVTETTVLRFPCLGTEIPHQISWDSPRKGFLGLQRGSPHQPPAPGGRRANRHRELLGRSNNDIIGAGTWRDFSVQLPTENRKGGDRG